MHPLSTRTQKVDVLWQVITGNVRNLSPQRLFVEDGCSTHKSRARVCVLYVFHTNSRLEWNVGWPKNRLSQRSENDEYADDTTLFVAQ